jgi:hypothetical protein
MSLSSSTEPLSEILFVEYDENVGKDSAAILFRYDSLAESLEA